MKTRPLGASGIEASVIALGTWQAGGWMWGGNPESDSIEAIHASLDAGVNFIDTAPIYGFGYSEQVVGKAIRGRRDGVVLATKCGLVTEPPEGELKFRSTGLGPDPDGHIGVYQYLGPASVEREVEASLRRLGTDTIDLYQTHWQDPTTPIDDVMAVLTKLKQQGKVRAIGACNASVEQLGQYAAAGQLDSDQEKYSMLDRGLDDTQLPWCREQNVAVLAYSPLSRGLLTGEIGPDRDFNPGDVRRGDERFSKDNRQRVQSMLDAFTPIAEAHAITLAQLTIAWTVHQPGVTHALVGARDGEQAGENAKAGSVELTDDQLKAMSDAIDQYAAAAV